MRDFEQVWIDKDSMQLLMVEVPMIEPKLETMGQEKAIAKVEKFGIVEPSKYLDSEDFEITAC